MKKILLPFILFYLCIIVHSQSGSITNIKISQRTDGSGLVDVFFDLIGEYNAYNILMEVSLNGGDTYTPVSSNYLEGDTGPVSPGEKKQIIWNGQESFPNTFSARAMLKIIATKAIGAGIPCPGMPTFTDPRDGNVYNAVQIGNQCWLKENLRYLPEVSPSSAGSETEPHYYVYDYQGEDISEAVNTDNYQIYGVLYNWPAAMNSEKSSSANPSGVQGVCPAGWHLPSGVEWAELVDYVVSQGYPNERSNPNGAGNALKSCRQVNSPLGGECATSEHPRWDLDDTHYGTDQFGFSAVSGGSRYDIGTFSRMGDRGLGWSSTQRSSTQARYRGVGSNFGDAYLYHHNKEFGFSVRCIRDE